jgi:spermidine synthase
MPSACSVKGKYSWKEFPQRMPFPLDAGACSMGGPRRNEIGQMLMYTRFSGGAVLESPESQMQMVGDERRTVQPGGLLRRTFMFTVFLGSSLLFIIEPVAARSLLPRFGGTSTVWLICMVFFQVVLLLGYGCATLLTRCLRADSGAVLYCVLLLLGMVAPIGRLPAGSVNISVYPRLDLVVVLLQSVGLPFFLLSMTTPMLETWSRALDGTSVSHRLFVAANGVAVLALVSYPFLIEPRATLSWQWSAIKVLYRVFSTATIVVGLAVRRRIGGYVTPRAGNTFADIRRWIGLSATGAALWLSVAEHIAVQIAPVPLLWVAPLSLYLASFAIVYAGDRWYGPAIFRRALPIAAGLLALSYMLHRSAAHIWLIVGLNFAALFLALLFCHGELARCKPVAVSAGSYYFWIGVGGVLGSVVVAVLAPLVFDDLYELPVALIACGALSLRLLYRQQSARIVRLAVLALGAIVVAARADRTNTHTFLKTRDFYGVLRVTEENGRRRLYSGTVLHGSQFLSGTAKDAPTAYYGSQSGVGRALKSQQDLHGSVRVAVIGLGVGTLAAYGRAGDQFDFFELDPEVVSVANRYFSFLRDARCRVTTRVGDGRLRMASADVGAYSVIVVDAFSGDYIPTHLLTREALGIYKSHLSEDGVIGFHVTNQYLDFVPVLSATAQAEGMYVSVLDAPSDPENDIFASRWVLASEQRSTLDARKIRVATQARGPLWTDDYTNVAQLLR